MFRLFDLFVLFSIALSIAFSIYFWVFESQVLGMYTGIWALWVIGLGLYFKLLRIVHFVLYRNLDKKEKK